MLSKRRALLTTDRKPDHFDKIRAYYVDGRKLTTVQEAKRLQYEEAHTLRLNGYSKEQTVNMLMEKKVVNSISEGYRICNYAEILFGDVATANKDGLRVILTENFFKLYQQAKTAGNTRDCIRALENIAKINGLVDNQEAINWNEII